MSEGVQPAPAPAVKPLSCPACGASIELRAAGYTVTLVCPYCSSVLDTANPDVGIIQRYSKAARELEIPLGTRGTLKGVDWEAIGYLRRSEGGTYPWEEYLLFNPYHGYRWLVTDGRGWTFGTMLTESPKYGGSDGLIVDGQPYKSFFRNGRAQVDYVLGEFYWRVRQGEEVETADYVRPGFMLSFEGNEEERNWTLGELLDGKEMAEAFGVDEPRKWRPGGPPPLPHQPSPYAGSASTLGKLALLGIVALFVLTLIFGGSRNEREFEFSVTPGGGEVSRTYGPVSFDRPWQAVTIKAQASGLENAWVDLDYALVDRKSQTTYAAYAIAERYSGRDSDGAWTEGSRGATTKLATVPAGEYDLVVDASGQNWGFGGSSGPVPVTISIAQGATFWSNFILAVILLLVPAIIVLFRHARFETARTAESDQGSALANMMQGDEDE